MMEISISRGCGVVTAVVTTLQHQQQQYQDICNNTTALPPLPRCATTPEPGRLNLLGRGRHTTHGTNISGKAVKVYTFTHDDFYKNLNILISCRSFTHNEPNQPLSISIASADSLSSSFCPCPCPCPFLFHFMRMTRPTTATTTRIRAKNSPHISSEFI